MKYTPLIAISLFILSACTPDSPPAYQGYIEADLRYLASTGSGVMTTLNVERGQRVSAQQVLFAIDAQQDQQEVARLDAQLQQQNAVLDNLVLGQRPQELAVLRAQWQQARAQAQQSDATWQRLSDLRNKNVVSADVYDNARANHERDQARVDELQARLKVAELGARRNEIEAAKAQRRSIEAQREQALWRLQQKQVLAPTDGVIHDVLYRPGEVIASAKPVIVFLPDNASKIRFYVPEAVRGQLQLGNAVRAHCDGCAAPLSATIRYINPQVEYTPPVLFNRDNRSELMFRVEAYPTTNQNWAIGQPVDVWLTP